MDLGDFQAMNEVYARHVGDRPPARSTFQVAKLPSGALVEIEAVAVFLPDGLVATGGCAIRRGPEGASARAVRCSPRTRVPDGPRSGTARVAPGNGGLGL